MILPSQFHPAKPDDFIGSAASWARVALNTLKLCRPTAAPIGLFAYGPPGVGKSELMLWFLKELGTDKFRVHRANGTQVNVELVNTWAEKFHWRELFDCYSVIWVDEIDKASHPAMVRLLTLLDDLPANWAVLVTSNSRLEDFEKRFQSRFQVFEFEPPSAAEIAAFLRRHWPDQVSPTAAVRIAEFACGDVRGALRDLQTHIAANLT